jgi:(2Fe-2S) ferredoxin
VPFQKHIFICTHLRPDAPEGCCDPKGGSELQKIFKQKIKDRGLEKTIRANKSGCLDHCQRGAAMVIYPQGIWYGGVKSEDLDEILEKSILKDEVIARLAIPD